MEWMQTVVNRQQAAILVCLGRMWKVELPSVV